MPNPQNHTLDDLMAQAKTVRNAMDMPGVPNDEKEIYRQTLQKINDRIAELQQQSKTPMSAANTRDIDLVITTYPEKHIAQWRKADSLTTPPEPKLRTIIGRTITPGGEKTDTSLNATSIKAPHQPNAHNPTITITWEDGYSVTVTEAECTSRFTSTFRDLCNLKVVASGKYAKMWRWNTAWRAAGFLCAMRHFNFGIIPGTLQELEYLRPTNTQKEAFTHILAKAIEQAQSEECSTKS